MAHLASLLYIAAKNILSLLLILLANGHSVLPPASVTDSLLWFKWFEPDFESGEPISGTYNERILKKYTLFAVFTTVLHATLYFLSAVGGCFNITINMMNHK